MPLTEQDRLKGAKKSREVRQKKQAERRKQVKVLFESGMSKSAIAKKFDVDWHTIDSDLREVE